MYYLPYSLTQHRKNDKITLHTAVIYARQINIMHRSLIFLPSFFFSHFFRLTSMNLIHFHLLFWLFKPYKWIIPDFHIFGTFGINFDVIYGMRPVWYITNRTCLECPFWPENNELYWEKTPPICQSPFDRNNKYDRRYLSNKYYFYGIQLLFARRGESCFNTQKWPILSAISAWE